MYARRTLQRIEREARRPSGEPLDGALRKQMEARVGGSFEGVRVHTDSRANVLASELGSAAFTLRDHVFFGPGMYAPGTPRGDRVLAHELTHVAQGRRDAHAAARGPATVAPDHAPAEVEAGRVVHGERIGAPRAQHAHAIHRQPLPLVDDTATKPMALEKPKSLPWKTETLDQFAFDKDALTEDHKTRQIPDVAKLINDTLATDPDSFVTVVGYTDQIGTEVSNQDLGRRRANNVLEALVDAGVPDHVMSPGSLGKSFPVHDTGKADGANRRVEVNLFKRRLFEPSLPDPTPSSGWTLPQPGKDPSGNKPWDPGPILPWIPAPGTPPKPNLMPTVSPDVTKRMKDLGDLIAATGDAVARDKLIRELRDLWVKIQPLLPNDEMKKKVDEAITSGVGEGIKAALKAALEAIAGKSATEMPAEPSHTGPDVNPVDLKEHIFKTPELPLDKVPEFRRYSFEFRALKASYQPSAPIAFILVTPSDFEPNGGSAGAGRVVLLALDDYQKNGTQASVLDQRPIKSNGAVVSLSAPENQGTYVLAVRVGLELEFREVSREFKIAKP